MSHKQSYAGADPLVRPATQSEAKESVSAPRRPELTSTLARKCLIPAAALPIWLAFSFIAIAQNPGVVKSAEDLLAGPMQAKATTACTECHEARIIVQQRLSKAAWTKEVDKMIKWGAVIDASDRDPLIDYLSGNFGVEQPQHQPPRTSSEKKPVAKLK